MALKGRHLENLQFLSLAYTTLKAMEPYTLRSYKLYDSYDHENHCFHLDLKVSVNTMPGSVPGADFPV